MSVSDLTATGPANPAAARCPFGGAAAAGTAPAAGHRLLTHADVGLPSHTHRRGFDALEVEHDYWVEEVAGEVPAGFSGTLFRNGPGRNRIGGQKFGHWFDGDGMVSRVTFRDGRMHYRNRYVRTPKYLAETAAQRILFRGFGTQRPGGILGNAFRPPANAANTSIVFHAGRLLTLWEGGHPWQLDPATLDTVGEYDYEGALRALWPFSAHGKINPRTREYFNFGIQPGKTTRINLYRISAGGKVVQTGHFPLAHPVFCHDFALTGNHAVFLVGPVIYQRWWRALAGLCSLDECMEFDPSVPTRVLVVDLRTMQAVVDTETDPAVFIHFGNAWEDGRDIVFEVTRFPDFSVNAALRDVFSSESSNAGDFFRYRINLDSGRVEGAKVPGMLQGEFPVWDWRLGGQRHRYLWAATMANNGTQIFFNSVQKLDTQTGQVQTHDFGPGRFCMEPIFMPLHAQAAEDEGLLATLVYDYRKDRSEVVLLDASDVTRTVATGTLRHHVPFGFHGCFVPRAFI